VSATASVVRRASVWPIIAQAVRANLVPGAVLWLGLLLFLAGYFFTEAVPAALTELGHWKTQLGWLYAVGAYVLFAVWVPEALERLQTSSAPRSSWRDLGFASLLWGAVGTTVDVLYHFQTAWFGDGNDWRTITCKMLVDQFLYSPVMNALILSTMTWWSGGCRRSWWAPWADRGFWHVRYLPLVVAGWCVWIPGVLVVYFMPTPLQFPLVSMMLSFWVLIFRFMGRS
jgi:hypothetical protein